ncbi:hypothetical protein BC829DRAFT_288190 [Chytridium lagenaria]|nr:hypothetical protein BC829DRAFT_288190 [Chytridium lagenaria]
MTIWKTLQSGLGRHLSLSHVWASRSCENVTQALDGVLRLWNVQTNTVESFTEGEHPPYACISYCWMSDVKNYRVDSWISGTDWSMKSMPEERLKGIAEYMRIRGETWVWMDVLCTHQEDPGELRGSTVAMGVIYGGCELCYAFMNTAERFEDVVGDRWFQRVWTLQEAVLPPIVKLVLNNETLTTSDLIDTLQALLPPTHPRPSHLQRYWNPPKRHHPQTSLTSTVSSNSAPSPPSNAPSTSHKL